MGFRPAARHALHHQCQRGQKSCTASPCFPRAAAASRSRPRPRRCSPTISRLLALTGTGRVCGQQPGHDQTRALRGQRHGQVTCLWAPWLRPRPPARAASRPGRACPSRRASWSVPHLLLAELDQRGPQFLLPVGQHPVGIPVVPEAPVRLRAPRLLLAQVGPLCPICNHDSGRRLPALHVAEGTPETCPAKGGAKRRPRGRSPRAPASAGGGAGSARIRTARRSRRSHRGRSGRPPGSCRAPAWSASRRRSGRRTRRRPRRGPRAPAASSRSGRP